MRWCCRRTIALLMALLLMLGWCFPVGAEDAADPGGGKIINVVYDDSRSMYLNGETRWCQAKYAMEVFCAMLGEQDVMNIFSMNRADVLTIQGSDAERVKKVHEMTSTYSGTPFGTVTKAGQALLAEDPSRERWLVILTDGSFDNTTQATVQSTLDGYNQAGIRTVYLAIGSNAVTLQGDAAKGAFAEQAGSTGEILTKVTSIANQIFENQELTGSVVSTAGDKTLLNIDIPTEQIVVFAQGDGASVGEMTLNGETVQPTSVQNVQHSGDVLPLNNESIIVDTTLYGVVVTYDAGSDPFESGQFAVSVSGASKVSYYYRPGVTVSCGLVYRGQPVQADDELYAGDYEVQLQFIDPYTGAAVQSQLLSSAQFSLAVTNNGQQQTLNQSSGTVSLSEGEVLVEARAELPGNVYLTSSRSYTVLPEPIELTLTVSPEQAVYTPDAMGAQCQPVMLYAADETGAPLQGNAWSSAQVSAVGGDGVLWEAVPGADVGSWELRPVSADGSLASVKPGSFEVAVSVDSQDGNQYAHGAATFPLTVGEYAGSTLSLSIEPPAGPYELEDLSAGEGMLVRAEYQNPQTGAAEPLTEELWNAMELTAESDTRMDWRLEKGEEPGTWRLYPAYYAGDPLLSESGTATVTVTAQGESGEYRYTGSASQQADFEKLSTETLLRMLLPRVAAALFLLWLLIGYIKKKRLRLRGLDPRCRYKGSQSPRQTIHKDLLSVLLPYVPEKATVKCHKSVFQCNFPDLRIQAMGKRSFRIINRTMPLKTTKIMGEVFPDMASLRGRTFSFGSFDIASIDPVTKRTLGTFTFN